MIEDVLAEQEVTVDQQTAVSLMFLSIQPDDMPHDRGASAQRSVERGLDALSISGGDAEAASCWAIHVHRREYLRPTPNVHAEGRSVLAHQVSLEVQSETLSYG